MADQEAPREMSIQSHQDQDDLSEAPVKAGFFDKAQESPRAWIVVLGSFMMHFVGLGFLYSFSIFTTSYQELFNAGRAEVALISTVGLAIFFTTGIFSGRVADMYGLRPVFTVGMILWGIGVLSASFSNSIGVSMLTHGAITAVGTGCMYFPSVTVVPQWFSKRRAVALGLSVLGAGIGNLAVGIGGERLISAYGWRVALRIMAGVGTGMLMIALACLDRLVATDKKGGIFGDVHLFKERNFQLFFVGAAFFQVGYMVSFIHLNPYVLDVGLSKEFAAETVGLIGAGSAIGRVALGFLGDTFGRIRTFRATMLLAAVSQYLWVFAVTEDSLRAYAICYGFFSGGFIAMVPVVMSEYFGTARLGGAMGLINMGMIPGALGGAPLAGLARDILGDYTVAILVAASFLLIATVLFSITGAPPARNPDGTLKQVEESDDTSDSKGDEEAGFEAVEDSKNEGADEL